MMVYATSLIFYLPFCAFVPATAVKFASPPVAMGHDYDWAAAATLFACAVIVGIGSFLLKRWDPSETQTDEEFKGAKADVEKLHLKRSADWFVESHAKNVSTTCVAEDFNSIPIGCYSGNTNDPGA